MSPAPLLLLVSTLLALAAVLLAVGGVRRVRRGAGGRRAAGVLMLGGALLLAGLAAFGVWGASRIPLLSVRGVCAANLRAIAVAVRAYEDEFHSYPPSLRILRDQEYLTESLLTCPLTYPRAPYAYVPGLSKDDPPTWILAFDSGPDSDGCRFILYLNGDVRLFSASDFEREMQRFTDEYTHARGVAPTIIRTLER